MADKANFDDPAENAFLRIGYIPGWCRVWEAGVETWPGNNGKIPDDWDGMYPEQPKTTYSTRSGRSRRP